MKRLKKAINIKDELGIDSIGESNRDFAALYYDGKIWKGNSHGQILRDIQKAYKDYDLDYYDDDFAFLHMKDINGVMNAFVEDTTPIPFQQIADAVKKDYPNANVYSRSLADAKDIRKVANSRLLKVITALVDKDVLKGTLTQLSDEGRNILRKIEDYKFKLEQSSRIVSADPMLAQKINQKQKILDSAASQIYGIVFDIENIDITQIYSQEQIMPMTPNSADNQSSGEQPNVPKINLPGLNQQQNSENNSEENGSSAPIPQGGSSAPTPSTDSDDENSDKENDTDKDKDSNKDSNKNSKNKSDKDSGNSSDKNSDKEDSKKDEGLKEQGLPKDKE